MGWTGGQLQEPFSAEAALRFELPTMMGEGRLVDCAMVKADAHSDYTHVIYAACREDANEVFGLVLLVHIAQREIATKPITEEMGPNEDECPAHILDLLTPTDREYAIKWRERCRENLGARAGAASPTS